MRSILLAVMVVAAPLALANNDLEQVPGASVESRFTKEQVALAQTLPQTFVIRQNLKDKNDVQVVAVKEALKPNEKISAKRFESLAMNSELKGLTYNSSNELDATSSTSSWVVAGWGPRGGWGVAAGGWGGGWGRPYAYGYPMGYAAGYIGANYGCGGGYGYGYGCGGCYNNCIPQVYPQVYCGGVAYGYQPYASYVAGGYSYTYSGWGGY